MNDPSTNNSYELHEINAQQCLDMIHSTLIHDYHNTITDNLTEFARQLLKSPNNQNEEPEYSFTGKNELHTPMSPQSPQTPLTPLSQQDTIDRNRSELLYKDVFFYGFGVRFSYWIREWPDFVQPQYSELRQELLENDIYRISEFEWDLLQHRAAIFMQTNHG
eukprot:246830_1